MKFLLDKKDNAFVKAVAREVVRIMDERNPLPAPTPTKLPLNIYNRTYSVKEVALLTNITPLTVSRHIRMGLLEAKKGGKQWIITHENFNKYVGKNGQ